ncbi:phospholipid carrier-dependent glycosyltransferase [Gloeocapsopsis crepidinum LEGE 06123]|uniref:Polyprenol-phosphate-mannose--protein mannosyltransferase n=1 Tax=Gloeocapsopsis crepidinum LEGE 06123 TaxID=588587 RepID=A0ABR9UPW2_9CHRO|nr:phospholipid carrier-dependent glycosyltransferase [Gloeocapsopsis crepidinum]MBE9190327.1 phospholipid carrier-dependent glycosyltransferase [Gloeocapsopsis crepidinum LEGE 06123]
MSFAKKSLQPLWFWLGMLAVFLVSLGLRFWQLSRFNTLVFDEVYYAIFANNYLTRTQFFDGHPPLSKYIIAVGMWIGSHLPVGQDTVNSLTGSLRSTWSYRWLNALTGTFIPLVIAGIAYQISYNRTYALIAALFAAADGLFLVESRYALNNVYLVIFGLLGHLCFLLALEHKKRRHVWLALAGIAFGATVSVKWNGLWFLLGAYTVWIAGWLSWLFPKRYSNYQSHFIRVSSSLVNLRQIKLWHVVFYLGIVPVAFYSIQWIPHLQLNPSPNFWEVQQKILSYHQNIGSGSDVHPYCSSWLSWLFMVRPVAYFYYIAQSITAPISIVGPPLPASYARVIYDVHAIGNPILWWLSTVGIVTLLWRLIRRFVIKLVTRTKRLPERTSPTDTWIALYLVINWLANLLPWVRVTRCTFIYHYMGASVFAGLAIAWLVARWIQSYSLLLRAVAVTIIFLILAAFVFWMPIYLGLPLTPESYRLRMLSPTWI